MTTAKTTIAGRLMVPAVRNDEAADDAGGGSMCLRPGTLEIDSGQIVGIDFGRISRSVDVGSPDHWIIPGMVDCHLHLPQWDIVGAHGMPLLRWLHEVTFPAELRWDDPEFAAAMTDRAVDDLMSVGTTAIAAYATNHAESAAAAIEVATRRGMRGMIGQVLMDRDAPAGLLQSVEDQMEQTAELIERFGRSSRVAAAVTPRFAVSCTGELLSAAGTLAGDTESPVQTHLAETAAECELVAERFDGRRYVDVYRDTGLLTSRTIFGHGIHFDDSDRRQLAGAGCTIAHCPTANDFLGAGVMNRQSIVGRGVGLALGSDIGAGFERSMVRVGRAMILAAAQRSGSVVAAAEAWWQITHGNAAVLGLEPWGPAVGQEANLLVVEPTLRSGGGPSDLSAAMFGWDDRWIRRTVIGDRVFDRR